MDLFLRFRCLPLALALALVLTAAAQAQDKVTLATLDWPPYVGPRLKDQGYVAVIVREAFRRSGFESEIQFHQWSRVIGLAKAGKVHGYFPEYFSHHIPALFSDPLPAGPLGFFKRTKDPIDYDTLQDLAPFRIGVVQGYINSQEFDLADFLDKHLVNDDLTNFKLLLSGRVDLVVADRYVGDYLMRQHLPQKIGQVSFLPKILEEKKIYLCVPLSHPDRHTYLNAFNSGLRQMHADGTLGQLLPQAPLAGSLPQAPMGQGDRPAAAR